MSTTPLPHRAAQANRAFDDLSRPSATAATATAAVDERRGALRRWAARIGEAVRAAHTASVPF